MAKSKDPDTAPATAADTKVAVRVTARNNGHECAGMRFYQQPIQFYASADLREQLEADSNLTVEEVG